MLRSTIYFLTTSSGIGRTIGKLFPAKPLGCYGDGGAIFTDNDEWAAFLRSLAVHGKSGNGGQKLPSG